MKRAKVVVKCMLEVDGIWGMEWLLLDVICVEMLVDLMR